MGSSIVSIPAQTWVRVSGNEFKGFIRHKSGGSVIYVEAATEPMALPAATMETTSAGDKFAYYGLFDGIPLWAYAPHEDAEIVKTPVLDEPKLAGVGVIYDPSDLSTLFQDSAGTIPVTGPEQPVGRMLDKSGNGDHAFQATNTKRPILSARVNWLENTDDLTATTWRRATSDGTAAPLVDLVGDTSPCGGSVFRVRMAPVSADNEWSLVSAESVSLSLDAGGCFIESLYIKANAPDQIGKKVSLYSFNRSASKYGRIYNVTLAGEWQRISAPQAFVDSSALLTFAFGKARRYAAGQDGTQGISVAEAATDFLVAAPQIEYGTEATRYQRVGDVATDPADYDWQGWPLYLRSDGVDDFMETAPIDWGGSVNMAVIAGVRKLSDDTTSIVVELDQNTGSISGSFALTAPNFTAEDSYGWRTNIVSPVSQSITGYPSVTTNILTGLAYSNSDQMFRIDTAEYVGPALGAGGYANSPLYLFMRAGTSLPFGGHFYGMVIDGSKQTPEFIDTYERYLAEKTGVLL